MWAKLDRGRGNAHGKSDARSLCHGDALAPPDRRLA